MLAHRLRPGSAVELQQRTVDVDHPLAQALGPVVGRQLSRHLLHLDHPWLAHQGPLYRRGFQRLTHGLAYFPLLDSTGFFGSAVVERTRERRSVESSWALKPFRQLTGFTDLRTQAYRKTAYRHTGMTDGAHRCLQAQATNCWKQSDDNN